MIPREFLAPYLIANALALAGLVLAFRRPDTARWFAVAVFGWAAGMNTWTAVTRPDAYIEYAALTPSILYRDFILGWFSAHVREVVLAIAVGQAIVAAWLASTSPGRRQLGAAGALVFLAAIAPLGVGSGFPFSITFGAMLIVALASEFAPSSGLERFLIWAPRGLGVLLGAFLIVLALDAFQSTNGVVVRIRDFAVHLIPAAIVFATVAIAWRKPWFGGALFFVLAIAYAAFAAGRVSWMLVVSAPLVITGAMFLLESRFHRPA
jgi:hypothetical protein